jgi:valyl-tRNA synthetase
MSVNIWKEMKEMLSTKYEPKEVENNKYQTWVDKGYFKCGDLTKPPYTIVIPPPNVTGKLHIGHAWDVTLQDIIIRFKKMDGYDTLWLPGMDHAAIATEVKVVEKLKKQGINKYELGREKFLEAAWDWKEEYAANIRKQWAKMGVALDYSKERFTLDDGMAKAVKKVFVTLYNKGYIYRGERIINWDPVSKTALSNEEVIYKDTKGAFYHLKYYLEDKSAYLEVATTRPETLFGDTAVAVNPDDPRYQKYIGKNVILPIVNKLIPVIGDIHADPKFGTGIVKITPAHDPNDFEVGNRHNLERILIMNNDATMNELCGKYKGMDRFTCREALVKDLEAQDLLIKIVPITHSVGYSERTGAMIEPYLSKQWFVKMDTLAKQVLTNQENKDTKVNFVPRRFEHILTRWMENCHDWCISRQLWWGHRIPAWYKGTEVYVGEAIPQGEGWVQDEDVLDTWFSSALWPFATLGYPDNTEDFKRYFPTDCLVTGYDIIFFWVARMIFQSLEFTGQRPFKYCLIHGLIRDKEGRKMSKSLGNGVDPMDVIDKYGCDALRFFLASSSAPGMDLRYDEDKLAANWNFINKLWNASRFTLMNIGDFKASDYNFNNLNLADKWLLTKLNKLIPSVHKHMETFKFNVASSELYNFIWDDFCSNYIEFSKVNLNKSVLLYTLTCILKMLHPMMPFVTEEIYQSLPIKETESIMISSYPKANKKMLYPEECNKMNDLINFIAMFRKQKQTLNIGSDFEVITNINNEYLNKLLKLDDKIVKESNFNEHILIKVNDIEMTIYYQNALSEHDLYENMIQEKAKLEASILRRKNLLSNRNYLSKAPSNIVEKEKADLAKEEARLTNLNQDLK